MIGSQYAIDTATVLRQSPLANTFNRAEVERELNVQVEVSQQFNRNVQSAQREINQVKDKLTEQFKEGTISQAAYEAELSKWETVGLGLSMVAGGLTAPTSSALGIAAATISPAVAYHIGQIAKAHGAEGSPLHLTAHAILGAAVAAAGGNSALVGATSALTAEATAPVLAQYLYNKESAQLTAEEKHTIQAIANLAGAGIGASTGSYASIAQGGQSASNAVGNNSHTLAIEHARTVVNMKVKNPEEYKKFEEKQNQLALWLVDTTADFTPILGDIKGFVEAETAGDYFFAALGVIPFVGDAATAFHKAEKSYSVAKAAGDVDGMKNAINQASTAKRIHDFSQRHGTLASHWFVNGEAHWINPLTNQFEKIPANATVSVDHILPRHYFENEITDFKKLPKDVQKALINDVDNLQPMVHSANCSKGCKVEFKDGGWKTWNGKEVHPEYKERLGQTQIIMLEKVQRKLKMIK